MEMKVKQEEKKTRSTEMKVKQERTEGANKKGKGERGEEKVETSEMRVFPQKLGFSSHRTEAGLGMESSPLRGFSGQLEVKGHLQNQILIRAS